MAYDIDRLMQLATAVDISDLDWEYISRVGITDQEARCLRCLSDIESHAILYQADLLAGHTKMDYELVAFLSCWAYEEMHHGWALDKFLAACGHAPPKDQYATVTSKVSLKERIEAWFAHGFATVTTNFAATHMAWGALNEMTSSLAYTQIARYTQNRELAKLVTRMAKDERRHLAFYYQQAERRLTRSKAAQRIARFAFRRFWDPVGTGVGDADSFGLFVALLFDNEQGRSEFRRIDENMSRLPGLEGFDLAQQRLPAAGEAFKKANPEAAREIAAITAARSSPSGAHGVEPARPLMRLAS